MIDSNRKTETRLSLTCPICGDVLSGASGSADRVECTSSHQYSLMTLLFAQSTRADALLSLGTRLLQEQEQLFRSIARQLRQEQALAALRLEAQADRLRDTTEGIRTLLEDAGQEFQSLREFGGSFN